VGGGKKRKKKKEKRKKKKEKKYTNLQYAQLLGRVFGRDVAGVQLKN